MSLVSEWYTRNGGFRFSTAPLY